MLRGLTGLLPTWRWHYRHAGGELSSRRVRARESSANRNPHRGLHPLLDRVETGDGLVVPETVGESLDTRDFRPPPTPKEFSGAALARWRR